mgnify:CR=1 FL=1
MKMRANVKITTEDVRTGVCTVDELHNTSCLAGMESLANRLIGANTGEVKYFAVGTGVTAPSEADTKLETEIERKQISVRGALGTVAHFRVFFNTSEANGVLKEIGLFGDTATITADSGVLFARALINKTKTSNETLTIDWSLSIE